MGRVGTRFVIFHKSVRVVSVREKGEMSQATSLADKKRPPHHGSSKWPFRLSKVDLITNQPLQSLSLFIWVCVDVYSWLVVAFGLEEMIFSTWKNNQHNTTVDGRQLMPVSTIKGSSNQQPNSIIVSIGIYLVCLRDMSSKEPFSGWLMRRCRSVVIQQEKKRYVKKSQNKDQKRL